MREEWQVENRQAGDLEHSAAIGNRAAVAILDRAPRTQAPCRRAVAVHADRAARVDDVAEFAFAGAVTQRGARRERAVLSKPRAQFVSDSDVQSVIGFDTFGISRG